MGIALSYHYYNIVLLGWTRLHLYAAYRLNLLQQLLYRLTSYFHVHYAPHICVRPAHPT